MLGVVFAAGLGTRLAPLTERLPKPVVPVMNRPLASFSLERLGALGVRHCALNTHHLADEVPGAMEGFVPSSLDARFVYEPSLLGTGGGLRNAVAQLVSEWPEMEGAPVVVMNGDILFWPDLEGALALHERLGAWATMVLRTDPRARQFGAIETDSEGRVRRILGRPEAPALSPLTEHMFTGAHILSAAAVASLPEQGCVVQKGYRLWLAEGRVIAGFVDASAWRDLGTPAEYLRAHLDFLDGSLQWPSVSSTDAIAKGAQVDPSARLEKVVVGEGARIAAGVSLSRVVVWPGAVVEESASNAIVAPHVRVVVDG